MPFANVFCAKLMTVLPLGCSPTSPIHQLYFLWSVSTTSQLAMRMSLDLPSCQQQCTMQIPCHGSPSLGSCGDCDELAMVDERTRQMCCWHVC